MEVRCRNFSDTHYSINVEKLDEEGKSRNLTLVVPGGLAGQLFAVGYAAWIAKKRSERVHIIFYDIGTTISKFGVQGVLDSDVAKSLEISYSVVNDCWPPPPLNQSRVSKFLSLPSRIKNRPLLEDIQAISLGVYLASTVSTSGYRPSFRYAVSDAISRETLVRAASGSIITGYPTDYRIIEESWELLASMIALSGCQDFAHDTGNEDTVAVHWRLGDYVQNAFHGAIAWNSLNNCLKYANKEEMPVRIFTDSPDLAKRTILESQGVCPYEILSSDIWSDLFSMTRSRVFVGSNSGVSFLAALSLRSNNHLSATWLPDTWFLDQRSEYLFHLGPETAKGSAFYPARLVTSPLPL